MNSLARDKIHALRYRTSILTSALQHFGSNYESKISEKVAAAVDFAYNDDLLFEEFEIWNEEKSDEALLYQVDHFFASKDKKPLPREEADLTGKDTEIEKIQTSAEWEIAQIFAQRLQSLADSKNLKTNAAIGKFLDRTGEQVRVMLEGKHKPQRKTLLLVAKKFGVTVESLISDAFDIK